jgi:rhamnosyltransferase
VTESSNRRYCAAIVLFNPDDDLFVANIAAIVKAGLTPIVFDNTPTADLRRHHQEYLATWLVSHDCHYLTEGRNVGLSAAYNKILEYTEKLGSVEGVLFLDQDSTLPIESIHNLLASYQRVKTLQPVGVISGMAMRPESVPYRVYALEHAESGSSGLVKVKMTPSSFSFVPVSAINVVGKFYDDFFIDHIDVDFCYRCRNAGLLVAMDTSAPFPHRIGHGLVTLLGKPITPVSSPFRHYYQVRNIILSARRRGASWFEATNEVVKRFIVIGIVGLAAGEFWKRYRYALWGLRDGVRNQGGPLPQRGS